jgi:hypothetical protein
MLSASNWPGVHLTLVLQYGCELLSWYLLSGHSVQLAALAVLEKLPEAQSTHRSGVELVVSASYLPGLHGCFVSQNGWPVRSWYLPVGQTMHSTAFTVLENWPASQFSHDRSVVLVPALATCCPAVHVVCVWQKAAFTDELKLPLLQGASIPFKQNEPAEQLCWSNLHVPVPVLTAYQKPGTSGVAAAHPPGQSVPGGQAPEQLLLLDP